MNKTLLIYSLVSPLLLLALFMNLNASRASFSIQDEASLSGGLIGKKSPELSEGHWINSSPHRFSDFQDRVVLLEFWTYGCYNCRNTIPVVNEWQKKYANQNFAIIGVHTPEFDTEKNLASVQQQVVRLGIQYAVVTDNEYATWESYHQQFWPTIYLIDKKGIIRYQQIGEGNYNETERMIRTLITER